MVLSVVSGPDTFPRWRAAHAMSQTSDTPRLTAREETFAVEYVINGGNGAAAARKAGYKDGAGIYHSARRLLAKPHVQQAIIEARRAILSNRIATTEEILAGLTRIAMADAATAVDERGNLIPLHEMPADTRQAIAGIKITKKNLTAGDGEQEDVVEVKWWDKVKAWELLGKYRQLWVERTEINVTASESVIAALMAGRQRIAEAKRRRALPDVIDVTPAGSDAR